MSNRTRFWLGIFLAGLCLAAGPVCSWAADRGEDLASEAESAAPAATGPRVEEPAATLTKDQERPALKLPDVVVKGEKQFQVTAERQDLLFVDPMAGAKEIPMDFARVAIPGLEGKQVPGAETVTAKNYFLLLEAGAGPYHVAEGRVVVGQKLGPVNYLLRGNETTGEWPRAFAFIPDHQGLGADLDVRWDGGATWSITGSLAGKDDRDRQPAAGPAGWGPWLQRRYGEAGLQTDWALSPNASLNFIGAYKSMRQAGIPGPDRPELLADIFNCRVGYEQIIPGLIPDGLSLEIEGKVQGQSVRRERTFLDLQAWEAQKTLSVTSRFRLFSILHANLGVRLDDFEGPQGASAANVVGQISLVLPTGSILYATAQPAMLWKAVSEWAFENSWQASAALPRPESVYGDYRVGWRQTLGGSVSLEAGWFKRDATQTPVWTDDDQDGLFTYANLPQTHTQGGQMTLEVRYLPNLQQTLVYEYREATAGRDRHFPYQPQHEGRSEIHWDLGGVDLGAHYRFLGERFSRADENAPSLDAAHLFGASVNVEVSPGWTVFGRLDNILGVRWEKWRGYPERGHSGLAGLRVIF